MAGGGGCASMGSVAAGHCPADTTTHALALPKRWGSFSPGTAQQAAPSKEGNGAYAEANLYVALADDYRGGCSVLAGRVCALPSLRGHPRSCPCRPACGCAVRGGL